jgi:hypothetical protein
MRDIRGLREVEELIRANSEMRSGVYNPASLSAYSLAQNNPTTFTDPDGNTPAAACAVVWVPGIGQAVCAGGLIATALLAVGIGVTLMTPGDTVVKAQGDEGAGKAEPGYSDDATPGNVDDYTDKVGKIAKEAGKALDRPVSVDEVKDAIHKVKEGMSRVNEKRNPHVKVDPKTGDVRPKTPRGLGDSIGNIFDHLE